MAKTQPATVRAPDVRPGQYSDGHPLDDVQYLECKLILKPECFTGIGDFFKYDKLVAKTAKEFGIDHLAKGVVVKPQIREVLFLDTADFRLYNNAFILRRRIKYEDGFPAGDPEVVFKFRHPDLQMAAELDVRPKIVEAHRIKFKAEALPPKDGTPGIRLLYSHNTQFPISGPASDERRSMAILSEVFPALAALKLHPGDKVELVNQTIVEEVLQDLGTLDFGKGVTAESNIAIWRERGTHRPMCGEYAFEVKFKRRDALHQKAMDRARGFFVALQKASSDWLLPGVTKTGLVYQLRGNPPQSHE